MAKGKTKAVIPLLPTRHSLPAPVRAQMVALLQSLLTDSMVLFSHIKQAHWNVKGMNFIALHELFDRFAGERLLAVDALAERITALGGVPRIAAGLLDSETRLPDLPAQALPAKQAVEALAERFAALGVWMREGIGAAGDAGDEVTADLITGQAGEVDQALYLLEAHLQG